MAKRFSKMDKWSSEQVGRFKAAAQEKERTARMRLTGRADRLVLETLIAEGDSWFDYLPGTDVIDCLRHNHNYIIENYSKAGDTLENMIYGTRINRRFERVSPSIEQVLRRLGELKPKVFLFSGGGNDVAGDEFESYLNHKESGLPVLRDQYVNDMLNQVFLKYLEDLIEKVAAVSPHTHIITHGYGRTAPTGIGVDVLWFSFVGPWLRPALARKGIFGTVEQRKAVFTLIDKYNAMLAVLDQKYLKFHHVDLRDMIDPDRDWVNELHLRNSGFAQVAQRIHRAIKAL